MERKTIQYETNLDDFFRSIEIKSYGTERRTLEQPFQFCHSIINNPLSHNTDTFLWVFIFCVIDLILMFSSIPVTWFYNLEPSNFLTSDDTSPFLFSKVLVLNFSGIMLIISVLVLITQWVSLYVFVKIQILPRALFRILNFLFVFYPQIVAPFHGICFGSVIVSNSQIRFRRYSQTVHTILISLVFVLIVINYVTFHITSRYSLTFRSGHFGFWQMPHSTLDLIIFFLCGVFFPIRNSTFYQLSTIYSILIIGYGSYRLISGNTNSFVSLSANFVNCKISLDFIVYGVFSLINIWVSSSSPLQIVFLYSLTFITCILSGFIAGFGFYSTRGMKPNLDSLINLNLVPKQSVVLSTLRNGIEYSDEFFTSEQFIKWIMLWRFTPSMLPDISRICLIKNYDMKLIPFPRIPISSTDFISLRFLAYQIGLYRKYISDTITKDVENAKSHLEIEISRAKQVLKDFWTEDDLSRHSIYDLSKRLGSISKNISIIIEQYPNSKLLVGMWDDYCNNVIMESNQFKPFKDTPLSQIANPKDTPFAFLSERPKTNVNLITKIPSDTESRLENKLHQVINPLSVIIRTIVFFHLFFLAVINFFFVTRSQQSWSHFQEIRYLTQMENVVVRNMIHRLDSMIILPGPDKISSVLGISNEEASAFRSSHPSPLSQKFLDNLKPIWKPYSVLTKINSTENCTILPPSMLLELEFPVSVSNEYLKCRTYSAVDNSISLSSMVTLKNSEFNSEVYGTLYLQGSLYVFFFLVLIIIFFYYNYKENHYRKHVFHGVQRVKASISNYRVIQDRKVLMSSFIGGLLMIILQILGVLSFFVYISSSKKFEATIKELISQYTHVTSITSSSQNAYALSIIGLLLNGGSNYHITKVRQICDSIFYFITKINSLSVLDSFNSIDFYQNWSSPDSSSYSTIFMDFAQMLYSSNLTVESFRYLYSRYLFQNNISKVLDTTIPLMWDYVHITVQAKSNTYVYVSYFFIICYLSLLAVFEIRISMIKNWFKASYIVIRRAIAETPDCVSYLSYSVFEDDYHYLEELPFPALLQKNNGTILFANSKIAQHFPYSTNQIIGQNISLLFGDSTNDQDILIRNGEVVLKREVIPDMSGNEMVIFRNVTSLTHYQKKYHDLLHQITPKLPEIPFEQDMYYVCAIFPQMKEHDVIHHIGITENEHPGIVRIACSGSIYGAMIYKELDSSEVVRFMVELMRPFQSESVGAITEGVCSVISLSESGACTVAVGDCCDRAHSMCQYGPNGRLFIETEILRRASLDDVILDQIQLMEVCVVQKK